ncbi:MAG: DEAD/DEAH box helicase [Ruminiclostridium sp.]|nr:DEAD/DEAH box helicase [Ruminiclostridium sp.]
MPVIYIPKVEKQLKIGKNIIRQVRSERFDIEENSLIRNVKTIEFEHDGKRYVIYKKTNDIDSANEYRLKNKRMFEADEEIYNIEDFEWIAHPKTISDFDPAGVRDSWDKGFNFLEEDISSGINGLRTPQIGGIHAVLAHWKCSDEIGTVVMPTGTGKTETMISLLVANKCEKVLITVPTDPLREQIAEKFIGLGLLKKFGIISERCNYPIVGIIQEKFKEVEDLKLFIDKCNVIITTMKIVSESDVEYQNELSNRCSHLFIDEAHHVKAPLWQEFRNRFASQKVVQFTATPFRNDGQRLDGEIIYNYPLKKAQSEGYYRKIRYFPVTEYIPEEADQKIADKAVEILREDISKGYNHILMARCRDISRAQIVYKCYEKFTEFNPVQIHTKLTATERREIRRIILEKKTRIIVCVDMLGEGFDLPELKIASFHDIKKSLPVTLQLAGRFTRTKYDETLGEAAFVVNIVEIDAKEEIEDLYAQDANWNYLLPQISTNYIRNERKSNKMYRVYFNIGTGC